MKIEKINVYQVDLPVAEGSYKFSDGKQVSVFDSSVVELITDSGIKGYGEVCPLGSQYLPSYAAGVQTGLKELCPNLIGEDPLLLHCINDRMDYLLKGHPYVKTALDIACWDILGKFAKMPVCHLLGGRYGESVELYRAISQIPPKEMSENVLSYHRKGYKKFQLKLGGKIDEDIDRFKLCRQALDDDCVLVGDANTGWLTHQAIKIANAISNLDVYMEQPCATYEECLTVRKHTNLPFILDENIDDIASIMKLYKDHAADIVNIKIGKLGGLTKAKQARDLCVSLGIAMTIEDTWGGDIVTATIAHLAHSTPVKYRFSSTDFNSYGSVTIADGAPCNENGTMKASKEPGLGIRPRMAVLSKPVLSI